jgi:methylated-DNA-[protein]-cysteine S-methyltransferase
MRYFTFLDSPLQPLLLVSDGQALTGLFFTNERLESPAGAQAMEAQAMEAQAVGAQAVGAQAVGAQAVGAEWVHEDAAAPFPLAKEQLRAYFAGELTRFTLPLALHGTPFQRLVWEALGTIPYGTTISYRELARQVGRPRSVRAVGQANGRNPVAIIVPCHRVIGADGRLTGYGGGLERKEALLALEASVTASRGPAG